MAKKTTKKVRSAPRRRSTEAKERDAKTQESLKALAGGIAKSALSGVEPTFDVPTRSSSNTTWNKKRGILQMGSAASTRQIFNLGQARKFMQSLRHAHGISRLIDQNKTTSLRGMFYTGLGDVHDASGKKVGETVIYGEDDDQRQWTVLSVAAAIE